MQIIDLLNSFLIADVKPSHVKLLASKVINSDHKHYLHDALYIFAENANATQHNLERLQSVNEIAQELSLKHILYTLLSIFAFLFLVKNYKMSNITPNTPSKSKLQEIGYMQNV